MERRLARATEGQAHPDAAGRATEAAAAQLSVLFTSLRRAGAGAGGQLAQTFFPVPTPPPPLPGDGLGVGVRGGSEESGAGGWCSAEPDFA